MKVLRSARFIVFKINWPSDVFKKKLPLLPPLFVSSTLIFVKLSLFINDSLSISGRSPILDLIKSKVLGQYSTIKLSSLYTDYKLQFFIWGIIELIRSYFSFGYLISSFLLKPSSFSYLNLMYRVIRISETSFLVRLSKSMLRFQMFDLLKLISELSSYWLSRLNSSNWNFFALSFHFFFTFMYRLLLKSLEPLMTIPEQAPIAAPTFISSPLIHLNLSKKVSKFEMVRVKASNKLLIVKPTIKGSKALDAVFMLRMEKIRIKGKLNPTGISSK